MLNYFLYAFMEYCGVTFFYNKNDDDQTIFNPNGKSILPVGKLWNLLPPLQNKTE